MIGVLISTTVERFLKIRAEQFPASDEIKYFISCQGELKSRDEYFVRAESLFDNYELAFITPMGLSKNRNNAIELALKSNDYCDYFYIADDDILLSTEGLLELYRAATLDSSALASGMVKTNEGLYKNYFSREKVLNRFNCSKLSSVELLISRDFIDYQHVRFDERFGLGANYPSGEEYIFANDIIKNRGAVKFYPRIICEHPPESSGADFFTEPSKIKAKGAMLYRALGSISLVIMILFSIKKYRDYKDVISFKHFVKYMFLGFFELLRNK